MPVAEINGFNFDEYVTSIAPNGEMGDFEIAAALLGDENHFWAYSPEEDRYHLFARSKSYAICQSSGEFVEMVDFGPYQNLPQLYPHRVVVDQASARDAMTWAIDNSGAGAVLDVVETGEVNADDLNGFEWIVFKWTGSGLAMSSTTNRGEVFDQTPEVFFFKDKAKAALFRTFVG